MTGWPISTKRPPLHVSDLAEVGKGIIRMQRKVKANHSEGIYGGSAIQSGDYLPRRSPQAAKGPPPSKSLTGEFPRFTREAPYERHLIVIGQQTQYYSQDGVEAGTINHAETVFLVCHDSV